MNQKNSPLVSMVMGAYNGEKYIEGALCSALGQEYPNSNINFIVVDDGSTDKTREIVASLQEKDDRIQLVQNDVNQGIAKTLNRGIANASGEYIAILDQDDIWIDPYKIQKQVSFLQLHPEISILGTNGIIKNNKEGYYYSDLPHTDEEIRESILCACPFMHSSVMYKKDMYNQIGGYPTDIKYCPDFAYRLEAGKTVKFANLPDYTFLYETNNQNTCYSHHTTQTKEGLTLLLKYRNEYPHLLRGIQQTLLNEISTYLSKQHPNTRKLIRKLSSRPDPVPLDTPPHISGVDHQYVVK